MAAPHPTTAPATQQHRLLAQSPAPARRRGASPSVLRLPLRVGAHAQRARISAPAAAAAPAASTASADGAAAVAGKPTVLVAEKLGAAGLGLLREFANVDCSYGLSPEELRAKISLCDALIVRSGTKVGRDVFEASGGRLRVVGRAGVGIDNVDLAAATEHGCLVVNAPTANTVAAAEHAIALLTAMARNVAQADASLKAGECAPRF
jgi:D-3-phosphoglycerate dehydrogenase / 2-oxoglutarate reductase